MTRSPLQILARGLAVWALLVAVGCGPLVTKSPTPTSDCESQTFELLEALHRARIEHGALSDEVNRCWGSLLGGSRLDREALGRVLVGVESAMTRVRHRLQQHAGSLQSWVQRLQQELDRPGAATNGALSLELAAALERSGELEQAAAMADRASALAPEDPWATMLQVRLQQALGVPRAGLDARVLASLDLDVDLEALDLDLGAQRLDPLSLGEPEAWVLLASTSKPSGLRRFAAQAGLVGALVADPTAQIRVRLAQVLARRPERWGDAWRLLADGVTAGHYDARVAATGLAWRMGEADGSRELLLQLAADYPDNVDVMGLLLSRAQALGRKAEESELRARMLLALTTQAKEVSDDPVLWSQLARLQMENNDLEAAQSAAAHVVVLSPDSPEAHELLAQTLSLDGDEAGAKEHFTAAEGLRLARAEAQPGRAPLWLRLASLRLDWLDDLEGAANAVATARAVEPDSAAVHFVRCRVLEHQAALARDSAPSEGSDLASRAQASADAVDACLTAAKLAPDWVAPWLRLVELRRAGSAFERVNTYETLLVLDPERPNERSALLDLLSQLSDRRRLLEVAAEPLRWAGPNVFWRQTLMERLRVRGLLGLEGWLTQVALKPHLSSSPTVLRQMSEVWAERGLWDKARQEASTAAALQLDARPLLDLADRAMVAHLAQLAKTLVMDVQAMPKATELDFGRLSSLAKRAGLPDVGDWAHCMELGGDACQEPALRSLSE